MCWSNTLLNVDEMCHRGFADGEYIESLLVKGLVVEDIAPVKDKGRFNHAVEDHIEVEAANSAHSVTRAMACAFFAAA
jgi:hypothetical protein